MQPTCRQALRNDSDCSSFFDSLVVTKELRQATRRIAFHQTTPYLQGIVSHLKKQIVLFRLERSAYWHSQNAGEYLIKFQAAVRLLCDTALQRRQQLLARQLAEIFGQSSDPGCARARPFIRQ